MTCPLEIPKCKRSIMTSSKPFKKTECPLNVKQTCVLSPPACPLLPQENKCGYAKLMGKNGDVDISQCPCKSCFLNPGCPISLNSPSPNKSSPDVSNNNMAPKWPTKIPPCLLCKDGGDGQEEQENKIEKVEERQIDKHSYKKKTITQTIPKCSLTSSPRPLPCSECIVQELDNDREGREKTRTCPYLVLADVCGKNCYCSDVPSIKSGPLCPFAPKPCPCCATPRCPLSRKPDCILKPKPPCCLLSPKCGTCLQLSCSSSCCGAVCSVCLPNCKPLCGLNPCCCGLCLSNCKPLCGLNPCCCGLCMPYCQPLCGPNPCCCGLCLPNCKPLCGPNPCCCGLCFPNCKPLCGLNPCCCGLCSSCLPACKPCNLNPSSPEPLSPSCPLNSSICSCPTPVCSGKCSSPCNPNFLCPLVNPCSPCSPPSCPLSPCSGPPCNCSSVCSVTDKPCALFQPYCSSPSCIPCLLKKVECILNPCPCPSKSICPPIPPPCSLKNQLDSSNNTTNAKETVERTFHLPTCPVYEPPCEMHRETGEVCPFSPNPCPISSNCPFPISMSPSQNEYVKNRINQQRNINEDTTINIGDTIGKQEEPQVVIKQEPRDVGEGNGALNSQCPYSCTVAPLPQCPAAKILSPEIYQKPKIVEKKPCPFKKCITKPGCPLSQLKPADKCPLGNDSNCPFTEEPECPLEELAFRRSLFSKCSCLCVSSLATCTGSSNCPQNLPSVYSCTMTDGCSRSILPEPLSNSTIITPESIFYSNSILKSPSSSSSVCSYNEYNLSESISKENNFSSFCPTKSSSLNKELAEFDGCCTLNKSCKRPENSLSSSECPFEPLAPKTICPLAPPKCPLTPKPTTCPLTRKPDPCPLSMGGELICPVKFPSCKKFPKGRCPMGDINVCDCDYPVSPCLLPLQDPNLIAPPQYCFREDCCMGLPFPPSVLKTADGKIDKGPFYQFKDSKPGKEETKYYIEVLKDPPNVEITLFGKPRKRLHENWTIVKNGEGYLRCKTIAKKLEEMGPHDNVKTQYDTEDCPVDEETRLIWENRKKHLRDIKELERLKLSLGFKQQEKKKKKN